MYYATTRVKLLNLVNQTPYVDKQLSPDEIRVWHIAYKLFVEIPPIVYKWIDVGTKMNCIFKST